ncbi:hypothetical protein WDW89_18330 [Deltaproteobacteria bacterium TL4]
MEASNFETSPYRYNKQVYSQLFPTQAELYETAYRCESELSYGAIRQDQIIQNAEYVISLTQVALQNLHRIRQSIEKLQQKVSSEFSEYGTKPTPNHELNPLLQFEKRYIQEIATDAYFDGKGLLGGQLGVINNGEGFKVLSAVLENSYRKSIALNIEVLQTATRSSLEGSTPLSNELLQQECCLSIYENGKTVDYQITEGETVESLLRNLQEFLMTKGMDLEVGVSEQGQIKLTHNQYGSRHYFSARSHATSMFSQRIGGTLHSDVAQDCEGMINGKEVRGEGKVLVDDEAYPNDEQLLILCEHNQKGKGHLTFTYSPVLVQMGDDVQYMFSVYIRSCVLRDLGCGIDNFSEFQSLADLQISDWQTVYDTLLILQNSLFEVDDQIYILQQQQRALEDITLMVLDRIGVEDIAA